jgi:hypothetical protein
MSDIAKPMEQSKIVDFFSSSPSSQQSKLRTKKRHKPSPTKAAKGGIQSSSPNQSRAVTTGHVQVKPEAQEAEITGINLSAPCSIFTSIYSLYPNLQKHVIPPNYEEASLGGTQ